MQYLFSCLSVKKTHLLGIIDLSRDESRDYTRMTLVRNIEMTDIPEDLMDLAKEWREKLA